MIENNGTELAHAAKLLLDDSPDKDAYARLIGCAYDLVERGISSVTDAYGGRVDLEIILTRFLEEKIVSSKFLNGISRANDAAGYIVQVAKNFTRDAIRSNPPVSFEDLSEQDNGNELFLDLSQTTEEEIIASQEQESRVQWFCNLPPDDQLLMHILYAEGLELPDSMLKLLAKRRSIGLPELKLEIEKRADTQLGKREEWESEVNTRSAAIYSVQHRIRIVRAMIDECDYHRENTSIQLSSKRKQELRQSQNSLRTASAQERSGYLADLECRLSRLSSLQKTTREKLVDEFPAGQRYEEVLMILGQMPVDEKEAKKAVNTITVRLRRIRKRLRQELATAEQA